MQESFVCFLGSNNGWRSQKGHVTSHQGQSIEKSRRGAQGPPVHQIWCNSDHYFRSYGILKKMAHAIFFRSAAILKVLVRPNWFSNLSDMRIFGAIQAIFLQLSWSQHKLAHSCQGRGQRSNGAINRNKHFFRSFCRGISNLVTPSLTVADSVTCCFTENIQLHGVFLTTSQLGLA